MQRDKVRVLDPTAPAPAVDANPGPAAGALAGRTVGIRFDQVWRSFLWVKEEWTERLATAGANLRPWNAGSRIGEGGERTRQQLREFVGAVDVAIVGLGN
jgi:hypothetical protein